MNNLNNFGMNQINLNNMPFNNAGMNNIPQNLINENNMNIQFQILNYENRIKELENIIKQKDIEIAFLKEKLNNNGFNFPIQNFMNMNNFNMNMAQPNIMMQNQNNDISRGTQICVTFENRRNFICNDNDLTYTLIDKIMPNKNWFLLKFMCNGNEIHPFLRVNENGIKDGSIIRCNRVINIKFIENYNYIKPRLICAVDENKPFKKAIKFFLLKIGKKDCYDQCIFSFNDNILNGKDKTPVKVLFKDGFVDVNVKYNFH